MKIVFTSIFITLLLSGCGQQNIKQGVTAAPVSETRKTAAPILLAKNDQSGTMSDADLDALLSEEDEVVEVNDPIEPFNRAMFWVNDKLYVFLFNPLAKGWRYIAPKPMRVSISDFYYNIAAPIRIVSAALQGRGKDAYDETGRFLINSTIGILGFHDVGADHYGMQRQPRGSLNIGAAFGHWGIGSGMYLVLPFVGPSNIRDGIGLVADFNLYPPTYLVNADKVFSKESIAVWSIDAINALSLDTGTYDAIREQSLDPYLVVRDAYTQNRTAIIEENR